MAYMLINLTFVVLTQYEHLCFLPGYEIPISEANEAYKALLYAKLVVLTRPDLRTCLAVAANSVDLTTEFYYRRLPSNNVPIFISPICVAALQEMAPLMTEWNTPVITISGNSRELSDKKKYPSVISMSPSDNFMVAVFIKAVLRSFRWSTVFLLCDKDDSVVPFYIAMCAILKNVLRSNDRKSVLYDAAFNSADAKGLEFGPMLELISLRSRVIVVLTNSPVMRRFMIQAHKMNMTNGDYVYFFMQPFVLQSIFSDFTWKLDKEDDSLALEAFQVVLHLTTDTESIAKNIPVQTLAEIMNRLRSYRACQNYTTPPVEVLAAYGAVTLLAKVARDLVRKSYDQEQGAQLKLDGNSFVKELVNRTHNLSIESSTFDENGSKMPNFLIKLFNRTSGSFESVILFRGKDHAMSLPFGRNVTWPGGHLPENEPRCGFGGLGDGCANSSETLMASLVSVAAIVLAGLAGVALCFRWIKERFIKHHVRETLLSCEDLVLGSRYSCLGYSEHLTYHS